jgi:Mg/Co/Ni transporter MgtE
MSKPTPLLLAESFLADHPAEAARFVERFPEPEAAAILELGAPETVAQVLGQLTSHQAARLIVQLPPDRVGAVLDSMPPSAAAALLQCLPEEERKAKLAVMHRHRRAHVQRLLRYPADSAGALMDPLAKTVAEDLSVQEALANIRKHTEHLHHYLYVVDRSKRLAGVISVHRLLTFRPDESLAACMVRHPVAIRPEMRLPVVDSMGIFLGVVRRTAVQLPPPESGESEAVAPLVQTAVSLGELYWLGLCELFGGLSSGNRSQDGAFSSRKARS